MPILKTVFTKQDNGSNSEWKKWDGKTFKDGALLSLGQIYAKLEKRKGHWRIFYRMGSEGLDLPPIFKEQFRNKEQLKLGLDNFVEWAYDNQIRLLEAHERACDRDMDD